VSGAAQPITPIDPSESAGVWPRPRLAKRATALALNYTQWGYVLAGYTLWDGGRALWGETVRPLALPVPWSLARGELAWAGFCLLVTAGMVLFTFHGLHPYRVWQQVWRDATTPRLSVWRPVALEWEETAAEEAEEDEREHARRAQAHRAPVADADNPLGWVVD
jgi:hypothetical protein